MKIRKCVLWILLLSIGLFISPFYGNVLADDITQQNNSWICPNCNNEIDSNFCPDCGAKRPESVPNNTPEVELKISYTIDLSERSLYSTLAGWIRTKYEEIKPILEMNGYTFQGRDEKWTGNVYTFITTEHSFDITLFDVNQDGFIESIEAIFIANAEAYKSIYDSLLAEYGKPVINQETWYASERARWLSQNMIEFMLCGDISTQYTNKNQHDRSTLSQLKAGKHNFQLRISKRKTPLETDAPIITPSPTPHIESEISIVSAKLKSSIIPELFIVFKNNANIPVDRIDFDVKCFDAYDVQIKEYGYYDYVTCFYDATTLKKGQKSRSNHRWYMNGFDGIKRVEIAITRYHKTDGTIIGIPDDQLEWHSFSFK